MELTASAPVAASLWIATIVFTLLVIVGLCCVFAYILFNIEYKRKNRDK